MRTLRFLLVLLVCLLLGGAVEARPKRRPKPKSAHPPFVTTFYVRNGGGTSTQCTGLSNVDYDGSGTGEACAFEDPADAVTAVTYGDTIKFAAGQTFEVPGFSLTNKGAGSTFITLTTDGTVPSFFADYGTAFPGAYANATYTRVTPAMTSTMPKIVTTIDFPAINIQNDAHHWKIVGLEITNDTPGQTIQQLVGTNDDNSYITFEDNWLHPQEEDGTDNNIDERSINHAFFVNGDNLIFRRNAVTGFTGYNYGLGFRLEASSIISATLTNSTIENNLLEVNGQLFIGGGGGVDPAHAATATGTWTLTSGTLDNTTDLAVGDMLAIYNPNMGGNHLEPNSQSNPTSYTPVSNYANGRITAVNHGTGAITFTPLTSGARYRYFLLNTFGATGGTLTLSFMGQTTSAISCTADKATFRAALEALSNVAPGDFQVRSAVDDGYDYATFLFNFELGEGGSPGTYAYPTAINPMTVASSCTGGGAAAFIGAKASESYTPVEVSQDGTSWDDTPTAGMTVAWEGTQPHDVIIRRNLIAHRQVWTDATGSVKGFAEQKACSPGCIWDANIFAGQATGFVFTVRNQGGGAPWSDNSYTQFTNNLFEACGDTFRISNSDGAYELQTESHDLLIHNNLCLDPS